MIEVLPLLLNTFIIIITIFFYQIVCLDKDRSECANRWFLLLFSTVAMAMCIAFPIHFFAGHFFDLRYVPILVCFLYGGHRNLLLISIFYLAYRYSFGGEGFITSLIVYVIMLPIMFIFGPFRPDQPKSKRIAQGTGLTLLWALVAVAFSSFRTGQADLLFGWFMVSLITFTSFTMIMTVLFIEGIYEKKKLRKEVERAEKMYLVGELAASFAHEIRNPLTVVSGFLQLMGKNQIAEDAKHDYLRIMITELERAQAIISDYLAIAKPKNDSIQLIQLEPLLRQIIELMSPYALMNTVIIASSIEQNLQLKADASRFSQSLINIVKNGIEAMPDGGTLEIKAYRKQRKLLIEISDQGVGMTQAEIDRLGTPFYTTKEKGTGIGTMVALGIIGSMGGRTEVHSKKGAGTIFTIILPDQSVSYQNEQ
ncbi:two-component system, sporulation sensor kinase B [Paenibacillus tianmuensis]|uniref:histidine kinase n=1 Tax=Paenibacillus tianmuensis TaxID=624147 RepID=A0A1G4TSK6_9BACL|nr:ATP-binding protein [Paenibacillus tianmuensis]SCW84334.1 two-component system, sporulation sensor kinase B [Paenibacillus tianmuensis]